MAGIHDRWAESEEHFRPQPSKPYRPNPKRDGNPPRLRISPLGSGFAVDVIDRTGEPHLISSHDTQAEAELALAAALALSKPKPPSRA